MAFDDRPVSDAVLFTLLEAAAWACSSENEQPWRYVYAHRGEAAFAAMVDCLSAGNQVWAQRAAALVLCVAQTHSAKGRPNRFALHDAGAANVILLLQATELGLSGRQMGGFDHEKTRRALDLPSEVECVVFTALGYPGNPDGLPESLRDQERAARSRKPLREFVFHQKWNSHATPDHPGR